MRICTPVFVQVDRGAGPWRAVAAATELVVFFFFFFALLCVLVFPWGILFYLLACKLFECVVGVEILVLHRSRVPDGDFSQQYGIAQRIF